MNLTSISHLLLAGAAAVASSHGWAQAPAAPVRAPVQTPVNQRGVSEWLLRMHEASRHRSYTGTLVVASGGRLASSRIWHVCDGEQQLERVESLTGAQRSTFRRNDKVITFSPQTRVAVAEQREALGLFPNFLQTAGADIDQFYTARQIGSQRVAGFEADVVNLEARDQLRFSYRVWSEKKTGLVVKLQTLDGQGQKLDEVAFSELQLDVPVSMGKLSRMMANTEGYKVESPELIKTTAAVEGWQLKSPVPGFKPMNCLRRPATGAAFGRDSTLQWIFSDGLASVSLFIESYEPSRHGAEGLMAMGATHTLARRWSGNTGEWWLTVVGDVPAQTLQAFAHRLERKK